MDLANACQVARLLFTDLYLFKVHEDVDWKFPTGLRIELPSKSTWGPGEWWLCTTYDGPVERMVHHRFAPSYSPFNGPVRKRWVLSVSFKEEQGETEFESKAVITLTDLSLDEDEEEELPTARIN